MNTKENRPRTSEDFYLFCKIILEHENYDMLRQEDLRKTAQSPMNSAGSTKSDSSSIAEYKSASSNLDDSDDVDTESFNLVTCYCGKPYAKRPMIECSNCLTWLHLTCVKVKRNNIPEVFYCYKCIKTMNTNNINDNIDNIIDDDDDEDHDDDDDDDHHKSVDNIIINEQHHIIQQHQHQMFNGAKRMTLGIGGEVRVGEDGVNAIEIITTTTKTKQVSPHKTFSSNTDDRTRKRSSL